MMMGKSGAFTVGPTVKACTKGVWLWGKAMEIDGSDMTVLFLDTEGLGSTVRSETYDCRIFALALLLSSYFMYNSFGTIDGNAISKLSLVVNLTKHIHVRSQAGKEDSGTEFNQFFPHFLWVVRDFTVKLEKDGRKISAREYLEDALKPEEGMSEATESKNAVRMLIRNFFPERDCVTMVRPVSDEKQLMNLSSLPFESLRPEFKAQVEAMRKRIFSSVRPKTMYGKPLNGAMLGSLAEAYVAALNKGGTPTISTAWDRVVDTQCQDAVDGGLHAYVTRMQELLVVASKLHAGDGKSALVGVSRTGGAYAEEHSVVEEEDMQLSHSDAVQASMRYFQQNAVQDPEKSPPFEIDLRKQIEQEYLRFRKANDAASGAFCLELLSKLHEDAARRLQNIKLKVPKSADATGDDEASGITSTVAQAGRAVIPAAAAAKEYRAACDEVNDMYLKEARGPAKFRVLSDYLLNKLSVLLLDASISSDETYSKYINSLSMRVTDLNREVSGAKSRERTAQDVLAQEKKSFQNMLEEASRRAADIEERLRSEGQSRQGELDRLQDRFDKMLANSEAQSIRADELSSRLSTDLNAALKRIDELQSARITALMDMNTLSQRLVEAETARTDAERLVNEWRMKLAEESKAAAVLLERCRASENETVRLREQTELLYESVRVQKDLLAAKNDEKEECEYQWGVAKAKQAQAESERSEVQAQLNVMTSISTALKNHFAKTKGAFKGLSLDRIEQRVFDSLPGSS
jgi:hypothetical protein